MSTNGDDRRRGGGGSGGGERGGRGGRPGGGGRDGRSGGGGGRGGHGRGGERRGRRDDRGGRPGGRGGDRRGREGGDRREGRGGRPRRPGDRRPPARRPPRREPPPPPTPPAGLALADVDELEVTVEKLVTGGDGIARHREVPIFVPRSAPGDRLRVRLVERRPDFGRAEIVEILEPGPGRRDAPCPYFERCGGCDLQHIEDPLQVRYKAAAVVETLSRLGGVEAPPGLEVIAGEPFGYRLRTQLHTRPAAEGERHPAVGYYERGSHELVAVDRCPILVPALEELLPRLPGVLAEADRLPRRLDLAAGDGDRVTAAPTLPGLPGGEVAVAVDGLDYRFDARCFFQAHRGLLERLVATALGPPEWTGETAVDLYAGVGLFSLPLGRRYGRVGAVEGDRIAVRYARANARKNGVDNVEVIGQAVESWIDRLPEDADRVIVDPPRGGLSRAVRRTLLERHPRRITYVSCDAATLARDLRTLAGAYRLERLALVDLFPQSGHMESVCQLARI